MSNMSSEMQSSLQYLNNYPNIYSLKLQVTHVEVTCRVSSARLRLPLQKKRKEKRKRRKRKWESRRNHSFRLCPQVSRALERKPPIDIASRPARQSERFVIANGGCNNWPYHRLRREPPRGDYVKTDRKGREKSL